MSLDLNKVSGQVGEMVRQFKNNLADRQRRLTDALDIMHNQSSQIDALNKKIGKSKTTWLVAGLIDGLDRRYSAPPVPPDFTVIATDGSHIEVDRHQAIRCYLLNISQIILHYGSQPDASLESVPQLYASDNDLVISPPDGRGREQMIEGNLLAAKRSIEECRHLADLAVSLPSGCTTLALLDGTLMLWGLDSSPEFVTDLLLDKGLIREFERIRLAANDKVIVFGSYISAPRSTDVVNALRVAICPHESPDCDSKCKVGKENCNSIGGLTDSQLFFNILSPGERSAVFASKSKINEHYGEHEVHFYYIKIEDEIARVEIPKWVAADNHLINLMHCLILDQCKRGDGYPVALSEAHEQAVVTVADRQNFWQLVESDLIEEHLPIPTTGKSRSKRTRWV
jgi:hypothetical protein